MRPPGNSRLIETDSKPCLASSAFSACSLMRGIGQPRPGKSTAHHTGAKRLYSTVSEPTVDTNPAQYHLPSFASQFVGIGFVGERRGGAHDFGRRFSGFGHLESSPSQQ